MPMINIKFDDRKIQDKKIIELSNAVIKIVQDATNIPEVFVYADSPRIKIGVAPIEIFVEMSASKVPDKEELFEEIKNKLSDWKKINGFEYPITITLTPMNWKFEVGI
ncbi:MAG: hypothetical protein A3D67_03745 [Candidatus Lloydbacteria bacterium RIFCSPHIGHO2_02_FULL_51_22]|uniref:Uncharacterized protein n=3 Tax=Candidatus Lloydiibacteriota TaxID=1817910 RepID=A0A1G2DCX6_9BACT|nr:MAG: hypothetical protein A3D67_03745 [Candidatus Lloydbacteria bacterium RIFCSPHIGHO2_02_FULL_51_22]OGZ17307.1 MAG: hypothetical protein A3G11_01920 [Candidatus Lloydbacteria bacterium RIFCSPLOWO2_12_FULL_51_9]